MQTLKLIIAGGRDFTPNPKHWDWLDTLHTASPIAEAVCAMVLEAGLFGLE